MFSLPAIALSGSILLAADVVNAQIFTVNCQPLTIQRSDPIVNPGVASGHVHAIIGGTAFQRTMGTSTAVNAHSTTCDKKLDNSNYWVPQLYHTRPDGQFDIVPFQGSAVYYLNRACDYAPGRTVCPDNGNPIAPPPGLRMLSGNPTLRTFDPTSIPQLAISHVCLTAGDSVQSNHLPKIPCLRIRSQVTFPTCWDGVNLDSADHKSHVAFPAIGDYNFGVCPPTHPKAFFSLFYEFYYDTSQTNVGTLVYAMGDPTGYGLHGDFINGWTNQGALDQAIATCSGPQGAFSPSCSVNAGEGAAVNLSPEVSAPVENVGLNGPLPALPGNNPVTGSFSKRFRFNRESLA